jgi:hypothetical protein
MNFEQYLKEKIQEITQRNKNTIKTNEKNKSNDSYNNYKELSS